MAKLHLDHDTCRAYWNGSDLNLTVCEYRVLTLLASRPGSFFEYRAIYDHMRGRPGLHVGDGPKGVNVNVRTIVKRIRRKAEAIDPAFEAITNYTGYGYGLQRTALAHARCCPTCGQIIIVMKDVVIDATPRETVVDATVD